VTSPNTLKVAIILILSNQYIMTYLLLRHHYIYFVYLHIQFCLVKRGKRSLSILNAFDYNSTYADSELEEKRWTSLLKSNGSEIFLCEDGFSDNCILRKIHLPFFTITWRKRYNFLLKKATIVPDWEIYSLPRAITPFKEIMYRTSDMIEDAIAGKPIDIAYHCLAVNESLIGDSLVLFLNENRVQLLRGNFEVGEELSFKNLGKGLIDSRVSYYQLALVMYFITRAIGR